MSKKRLMEDPGHGGRDPGAIGPNGLQEKTVNLAVAKKLSEYLSSAFEVKLTRDTDIHLGATQKADLQARTDKANSWKADAFVSIHCNSSENKAAHGCEVYTTRGNTAADALAESIIKALEAEFSAEMFFRKDYSDGDADKEAGFAVLTQTNMPAVLVELAFISNPLEEALLGKVDYQARAAKAIALGIANYFGVKLSPDDPLKEAVEYLCSLGVITSPNYWLGTARPGKQANGEYVGILLQNVVTKLKEAK